VKPVSIIASISLSHPDGPCGNYSLVRGIASSTSRAFTTVCLVFPGGMVRGRSSGFVIAPERAKSMHDRAWMELQEISDRYRGISPF
jgi:hypothetical protein